VYSGLDLVVLTSLNEGTPVSLIEAMACSKPVVATDVGGVRDLMGSGRETAQGSQGNFRVCERGILVDANDRAGLAAAIRFILGDNRLRAELGAAGKAFVTKAFSKERLVKDIEELYENIIRE
jgi:glycosyltransferase involved in cell wall biosynthesis